MMPSPAPNALPPLHAIKSACPPRGPRIVAFGAATLLALAGAALASLPDAEHIVSQKGKRFGPEAVNLHPGEHITIVNDDSDFVHHAYMEAPDLGYDSGDIEPGGRAIITFPREGDFLVLCGVHPKMKLAISVR